MPNEYKNLAMPEPGLVTHSFSTNLRLRRIARMSYWGISQVCEDIDKICNPTMNLGAWAENNLQYYQMLSKNALFGVWYPKQLWEKRVATLKVNPQWDNDSNFMEENSVYVEITRSDRNMNIEVLGHINIVNLFKDWVSTCPELEDKEIMVDWSFGKDYREMETHSFPLNLLPPLKGAYPWMRQSIADYTKNFLNSKESVLVMKGPPGTGKTTFLKEMIRASETSAQITYDTNLLYSDGFFASFLSKDDCNLLILEDSDNLLAARESGNQLMDKLLNSSDGLVSIRHKKLIFTTNLDNVSSIDPALLRKGRCYDVLDFRRLTKDEAMVVAKDLYGDNVTLPEQKDFSLAEVTNLDINGEKQGVKVVKKIGFMD